MGDGFRARVTGTVADVFDDGALITLKSVFAFSDVAPELGKSLPVAKGEQEFWTLEMLK